MVLPARLLTHHLGVQQYASVTHVKLVGLCVRCSARMIKVNKVYLSLNITANGICNIYYMDRLLFSSSLHICDLRWDLTCKHLYTCINIFQF
jgi:hypothetical protein